MAQAKRKDKARTVLKKGEGQRSNGTYYYRWQDRKGNRHYLYAKTLQELREQEKQIEKDKSDGIKAEARFTTVRSTSTALPGAGTAVSVVTAGALVDFPHVEAKSRITKQRRTESVFFMCVHLQK